MCDLCVHGAAKLEKALVRGVIEVESAPLLRTYRRTDVFYNGGEAKGDNSIT